LGQAQESIVPGVQGGISLLTQIWCCDDIMVVLRLLLLRSRKLGRTDVREKLEDTPEREKQARPTFQPHQRAGSNTSIVKPPPIHITMSLAASRAVLRQSRFTVRRAGIRNASSTSEAAGAVKDTAAQASSKASEGLSKITSSASAAAARVGSAASNAASASPGRVGGLIGRVQG
jgi:hypothetical protein